MAAGGLDPGIAEQSPYYARRWGAAAPDEHVRSSADRGLETEVLDDQPAVEVRAGYGTDSASPIPSAIATTIPSTSPLASLENESYVPGSVDAWSAGLE